MTFTIYIYHKRKPLHYQVRLVSNEDPQEYRVKGGNGTLVLYRHKNKWETTDGWKKRIDSSEKLEALTKICKAIEDTVNTLPA